MTYGWKLPWMISSGQGHTKMALRQPTKTGTMLYLSFDAVAHHHNSSIAWYLSLWACRRAILVCPCLELIIQAISIHRSLSTSKSHRFSLFTGEDFGTYGSISLQHESLHFLAEFFIGFYQLGVATLCWLRCCLRWVMLLVSCSRVRNY